MRSGEGDCRSSSRVEMRQSGEISLFSTFLINWKKSKDKRAKGKAYSLACEVGFLEKDVEDLIAVVPHYDFTHFLETFDSIRIYITPRIYPNKSDDGYDFSLGDWLSEAIPDNLWQQYAAPPVTFPILKSLFSKTGRETDYIDLGLVLFKSDREATLARTLNLLASDFFHNPDNRRPEDSSPVADKKTPLHRSRRQFHHCHEKTGDGGRSGRINKTGHRS